MTMQGRLNVKRDRAGRYPEGGFTLLETVMVLLLLSLVLGLASVHFAGRMPAVKLDAAARELAATVRHPKSLACARREEKTITIDLDGKTFGIDGMAAKSLPPEIRIKVVDPHAGEIFTGRHDLVFPASGGAAGGAVVLWNETRVRSVRLDPVVGAAIVK